MRPVKVAEPTRDVPESPEAELAASAHQVLHFEAHVEVYRVERLAPGDASILERLDEVGEHTQNAAEFNRQFSFRLVELSPPTPSKRKVWRPFPIRGVGRGGGRHDEAELR